MGVGRGRPFKLSGNHSLRCAGLVSPYGNLNRVQSSRRLEREALRNVEVMWLTGRLAPDHKTIADFRKGKVAPSAKSARVLSLSAAPLTEASVAIDGSRFKAVNNRDKNFTRAKMERRMAQIEESPSRGGSASAVPGSGVLTSRLHARTNGPDLT